MSQTELYTMFLETGEPLVQISRAHRLGRSDMTMNNSKDERGISGVVDTGFMTPNKGKPYIGGSRYCKPAGQIGRSQD